jgi:hypothetical protein
METPSNPCLPPTQQEALPADPSTRVTPTTQGTVHSPDGLQHHLCLAQCSLCAVQQTTCLVSGPGGLWMQCPSITASTGEGEA